MISIDVMTEYLTVRQPERDWQSESVGKGRENKPVGKALTDRLI